MPRAPQELGRLASAALLVVLAACLDGSPTGIEGIVDRSPALALNGSGPRVVISQVYGGGGNFGATLKNDFIELYNAGTSPVSLTGWSVQYTSSAGSVWSTTNLAGSIAPGGYYLIRQAAGGNGTVSLPPPDATGNINMSLVAGKVALVNNQTTIAAGILCPTGPSIIDLVGFGSTTNCFEGTGPTATLGTTTAALRKGEGAVDTDDNAADFLIGPPNPRNSGLALPTVSGTIPANEAINVPIASNISLTFNNPVTVSGTWFTISCSLSGAHGASVTGSGSSYTLNPSSDFAGEETCTVTIIASQVADAADPSVKMSANQAWSFTTAKPISCSDPFTPAFDIQGSGLATPLAGQIVTTKGVVIGDYEGPSPALRGFYLQDATGDGDPATSDAVFVFNGNADNVTVGDVVLVVGTAGELQDQTQVSNVSVLLVCRSGASIAPQDVTLPVPSPTYLERYEGMLVRFPQTLTVTEHFQLARFGEIAMSAGGRLPQPTSIVAPGAAAQAMQAQNDLNRIIVDDDSNGQSIDPIVFGRGASPLSASNTLRGGDQATGIVGVMTYTWAGSSASGNAYRVRPVGALGGGVPDFVAANARPVAPATPGGSLKVASMNLLNYFNTFAGCTAGVGGAPTACRGAESPAEFDRQWAKVVAAIVALNADILGVVEIENDGYGSTSAIADLVSKVNAATAPGTYAFIDTDTGTGQVNALGTDAVKVGLLYKPASVTPLGVTAVLNSTAFVNGGDAGPRNRAALAQAFEQPNHARVVVSVNHFKNKGSACDAPDAGDGQGACNLVRTAAANLLAGWLATDPTEIVDSDVLIIGDLNAYAKEDPIMALGSAGYSNLVASLLGQGAYSYGFDGQWGYLDHALASASLAAQVTGVTKWHVNSDEPEALDYNTNFKSANQQSLLYNADAYRSADHDPLLVGLNLSPTEVYAFGGFLPPISPAPAFNKGKSVASVPVKFSLGGYRGMSIFAPGYPASRPVSCTTGAVLGALQPTVTAGQSGLNYDATTDTYTYVWKSDPAWAGTCRQLVVKLKDATVSTALFRYSGSA